MTATEKDLSLMKVHVFKTVDEYEAARSGGLIGGDDLVITPDTGATSVSRPPRPPEMAERRSLRLASSLCAASISLAGTVSESS